MLQQQQLEVQAQLLLRLDSAHRVCLHVTEAKSKIDGAQSHELSRNLDVLESNLDP
eukprot:COSAG05_NODE_1670_length_4305_cov_5.168093_2_plen_56_part_00